MELPAALRQAIDAELEGVALEPLRNAASRLSARYRAETRDGRLHLDEEMAVRAYLATRMPATYAAIRAAFDAADQRIDGFAPRSFLDIGAGPGTTLWAAQDCWPSLQDSRMIEQSAPALRLGERLAVALARIQQGWVDGDASNGLAQLEPADLVSLCYVLDELEPARIALLVEGLWALTRGLLVIVEPGTPSGWQRILSARARLIELGAAIAAPCAHERPCPLESPDWCHFAQRLPRSRLHRLAKLGDAPFEDEKFIYLAASRTAQPTAQPRVLAPPRQGKAWIDFKLCVSAGTAEERRVFKRDSETFRIARRLHWGDVLPE